MKAPLINRIGGLAERECVLVIAMCRCVMCVSVYVSSAAAVDTSRNVTRGMPAKVADENRWFLERYTQACPRLTADPSPLHGKMRFRLSRGSDHGEWRTIEFFVDRGKVRLQREYEILKDRGSLKPPDAMLLTSHTAATVLDPGTEFALATYLSEQPSGEFSHEVWANLWRFLHASYSIGQKSLSDHLRSGLTLESVESDRTSNGLLHLHCRGRVTAGREGKPSDNATVDLWLDANKDFAIRKLRSTDDTPYVYELITETVSYTRLPNGAWLPAAYSESFYRPKTGSSSTAEDPPGDGRELMMRAEYELLGSVETAAIPDSYFTLESLGVYPARRGLKWWLLLALFAAAAALLATLKRPVRRAKTAPGEESSP